MRVRIIPYLWQNDQNGIAVEDMFLQLQLVAVPMKGGCVPATTSILENALPN
jgi:hypothetical protein